MKDKVKMCDGCKTKWRVITEEVVIGREVIEDGLCCL
jgi:hypothetical protein